MAGQILGWNEAWSWDSEWGFGAGRPRAARYAADFSGSMEYIRIWCSITVATDVKFAVYSHDSANNKPLNLLAQTAVISQGTGSYAWRTYDLSTPISLEIGELYWLAAMIQTANAFWVRIDISTGGPDTAATWGLVEDLWPNFPDPWTNINTFDYLIMFQGWGQITPLTSAIPMFRPG